jgi:glycosyltransferase involved in cell wall biosynthesis
VKVLIVTSDDETIGGVAYVVGHLARQLRDRGHEILFFNLGKTLRLERKTTKLGFNGYVLGLQLPFGDRHPAISLLLFFLRFPIGLLQLMWLIKRQHIQIVNIHYPSESFFYFAICRWMLPIMLVTSVHGAELFPDGKRRESYPWSLKFLLHSSDHIVAPSEAYREDVATLFPKLRRKIVSIHNGLDPAEFDRPCEISGNGTRSRYILCVAMHNEKKGIDVLLRAFAQIQSREPQLRMVLAGDGPLRSQLESLAESLGIAAKVDFRGRQERHEITSLLAGCEVFVLPSRSEPFGIVLLEAMACGKPVISTTAGGIPEIIHDRKNGILVEPNNPTALAAALTVVLSDQNLRLAIANGGYATVRRRFCVEHTAVKYETLFTRDFGPLHKESSAAAVYPS